MDQALTSDAQARVLAQLAAVEGSSSFVVAPRLAQLLHYLVEVELRGEGSEINQSRIALEVMGRGVEFDPAVDSVVRVEAGRLRTKLRDYYAAEGSDDPIRFDFPKGRYNPNIVFSKDGPVPAASRLPEQQVRFLKTADDITLAWSEIGDGPPLIKAANWLSHLEFDFASPVWCHWWAALARRTRLIRYDERGCGLSDWEVDDFSVKSWVDDLECVVEAADVDQFCLLGISQGAAVAIEYAVRHPDRVRHLILYGGFVQGRLKRDPSAAQIDEADMLKSLARIGWGQDHPAFRKTFASLFMPDATSEQVAAFDALQRASTSPVNAVRFLDAFNNIDVFGRAAKVTVPTTVLHARDELGIPLSQGRLMASTIPGARLVTLDSQNHILGEKEPAWLALLREIDQILEATE